MGTCSSPETKKKSENRHRSSRERREKREAPMTAIQYYDSLNVNELKEDKISQKVQINIILNNTDPGSEYEVSMKIFEGKNNTNQFHEKSTGKEGGHSTSINFDKSFIVQYYFEKEQPVVFKIMKNNEFLVQKEATLGKLMGSRGQKLKIEFKDNGISEELEVSGKPMENINEDLCFTVNVNPKKEGSYFYILRFKGTIEEPKNKLLYRSELSQYKNSITFNDASIPLPLIYTNNQYENSLIQIQIYDGTDKIGDYIGTVKSLSANTIDIPYTDKSITGSIHTEIVKKYNFLDYLRGGTQIALTIGIDYTSSNGFPTDPNSLHYIGDSQMNLYERAIKSCGDIVAYYDYDQMFPTYGYGAVLPNQTETSFCFPITLNDNEQSIYTIDSVLLTYRNSLPFLKFSGPTNFHYLIDALNAKVKNDQNNGKTDEYQILMILTDGMISDMQETIDSLVEASFLPISVIIVGIGNADFTNMVRLDADNSLLEDSNGRKAARDLVQFVPFNSFANDGIKLAEQVLEEVPRQFIDYYCKLKKIPPGEPIINLEQ